jgi:phage terminase large subunit-like protein
VIALALRRKPNRILVEDAGTGTALVAELRRQGATIISIRPEQGKVRRMSVQSVREAFRQGAGQIGFAPDQDRPAKSLR